MAIIDTICALQTRITQAATHSPLAAPHLTLLAASKSQSAETITRAIEAGIADFGENRVQEAAAKWPELRNAHTGIRLHLIGPLQTNKVAQALALFDVIQTIDRPHLADALALPLIKHPKPQLQCYIQVNTGKEPQKAGVIPEEADALIGYCREQLKLPVTGLMCIPPDHQPPAPHFALLRGIAERHGLPNLSMGMSDDFETAIRMGSSSIRLGRALFGERG